jgi:EAL domain-containing protein (putative c-di-GMP-specific phosphodiesterase class I)
MHYHPCVDVTRVSLIGVEALARWRHEGAMVPPAEFITLAEENGLIVPIGEWALREASRQIREWRDAGLPIPKVSVNISTLHFERHSLAESVRAAIREHRLEPGMLEIELTESFMVRDFDGALGAIHSLRQLGVDLALDDFGTGYSSLSYLTRLPIGKLKIDRSFVGLIGVSDEDEAVVRAIVALGRSLRLQVVAEGVETAAQVRALLDMDCRCMQGFLFSRAVPAERIGSAIERIRARYPADLTMMKRQGFAPPGAAAWLAALQ